MRRLQTILPDDPGQRGEAGECREDEKVKASEQNEAERVVCPMDDKIAAPQRNRKTSDPDADHENRGWDEGKKWHDHRGEHRCQAQFPALAECIESSRFSFTPHRRRFFAKSLCVATASALSACVAPQMHTEAQLNSVATGCGMALGELVQDEEQKKLLLAIRQSATPQQRACVAKWARRNGLKPVFVNMNFPESGS